MTRIPLTSQEAREVQALAAAAARRNRPMALVALASLAMLASIIFASVSIAGARSARAQLVRLAQNQAEVTQIAGEIEHLRSAGERQEHPNRYQRVLQLSKLEAIGRRLNFKTQPTLVQQRAISELDSPIEKRRVDVTFANAPLDADFQWINEAQKIIPDLFISAIDLRPNPQGWTVRVQVARWELRP
jgi:type II secretory pathway component PulM